MRSWTFAVVALLAGTSQADPNPYCVTGFDWRPNGRMIALGMPGGPDDWDGSLGYIWGKLDPNNFACMTNPSYRWTAFGRTPPVHAYDVDSGDMVDRAATETWVRDHPGKVYLIGNEPNNGDLAAGDGMAPDRYAQMYFTYHTALKAWDPTSKIAVAGLVATSFEGSLRENTNYWNQVLVNYRTRYGVTMPIDIWNNHCYTPVGSLDPDRIIAEFFVPFRGYVDTTMRGVYAGAEIWCTEFGVAMWSTPLHPDYQAEFVEQFCPRLEASGAVDRFFWFLGPWEAKWRDSALLAADNATPTIVGETYSRLANAHPNPVPPPLPAPPPPPEGAIEYGFDTDAGPWRLMAGDWALEDGAYRQARTDGGWGTRAHLPYWYGDIRAVVDVRINGAAESNFWAGINLRAPTIWEGGSGRGFLVYVRQNGEVGLAVQPEGTVASKPALVGDTSSYHRLQVELRGSRIDVAVDGAPALSWVDPGGHRAEGYVCLEAGKTDCSFDNVVVEALAPRPSHLQTY